MRWVAAWAFLGVLTICLFATSSRADSISGDHGGRFASIVAPQALASHPSAMPEPSKDAGQVVQAPLPDAFWQGLLCLVLVLSTWRVCRTMVMR